MKQPLAAVEADDAEEEQTAGAGLDAVDNVVLGVDSDVGGEVG